MNGIGQCVEVEGGYKSEWGGLTEYDVGASMRPGQSMSLGQRMVEYDSGRGRTNERATGDSENLTSSMANLEQGEHTGI